jgi:hypothetical protein
MKTKNKKVKSRILVAALITSLLVGGQHLKPVPHSILSNLLVT